MGRSNGSGFYGNGSGWARGAHLLSALGLFVLLTGMVRAQTGNTNWVVTVPTNAPPPEWHFVYSYNHVNDQNAENFLIESTNGSGLKGVLSSQNGASDPNLTGWWTSSTNSMHRLVYHFRFPRVVKRVHIQALLGGKYTGCHAGRARIMLASSQTKPTAISDYVPFAQATGSSGQRNEVLVDKEAPASVVGTRDLWILVEFFGIADFSAALPTSEAPVFVVKAEYDFDCPKGGYHRAVLNSRTHQYYCSKCGEHLPDPRNVAQVTTAWGGGVQAIADSASANRDRVTPLIVPLALTTRLAAPDPNRRKPVTIRFKSVRPKFNRTRLFPYISGLPLTPDQSRRTLRMQRPMLFSMRSPRN